MPVSGRLLTRVVCTSFSTSVTLSTLCRRNSDGVGGEQEDYVSKCVCKRKRPEADTVRGLQDIGK